MNEVNLTGRVAGEPTNQPSTAHWLGRLLASVRKMRTVTMEEAELLERTAHVREKKESMAEFYARTGIGRAQRLALSKDELKRLVEIAMKNERCNTTTEARKFYVDSVSTGYRSSRSHVDY